MKTRSVYTFGDGTASPYWPASRSRIEPVPACACISRQFVRRCRKPFLFAGLLIRRLFLFFFLVCIFLSRSSLCSSFARASYFEQAQTYSTRCGCTSLLATAMATMSESLTGLDMVIRWIEGFHLIARKRGRLWLDQGLDQVG